MRDETQTKAVEKKTVKQNLEVIVVMVVLIAADTIDLFYLNGSTCINAVYILVGSPIKIDHCENPDESLVDAVHRRYMDELSHLFNTYKQQFGVDSSQTLNFF